jgi:hemoglobin
MTDNASSEPIVTPFEAIGGEDQVRQLVNRFYDLMEGDPAYAALRAMHAESLDEMRTSLTGFLTGWLGGPRDWFAAHPGVCIMSAHAKIAVTPETARQWVDAMGRALAEQPMDEAIREAISAAFSRMAAGMAR